jgi:hypothetical protein
VRHRYDIAPADDEVAVKYIYSNVGYVKKSFIFLSYFGLPKSTHNNIHHHEHSKIAAADF